MSELIPNEQFAKVADAGTQTLERMVTKTKVAGLLEAVAGRVAKMLEKRLQKRLQPLDTAGSARGQDDRTSSTRDRKSVV